MLCAIRLEKQQASIESALERFLLEICFETEKMPRDVSEALGYIHENLFDPGLNVKTLKSDCHLSDNNISSRFRFAVGSTIKEYIDSLRMKAAALLLRGQCIGVFDVAMWVGYDHPQTFYRQFQRQFKCTPAVYRQKCHYFENAS